MPKKALSLTLIIALSFSTIPSAYPQNNLSISNISIYKLWHNRVAISWRTGKPAKSKIEYGQTPSYGYSSSYSRRFTTIHKITLRGLKNYTTYHCRIVAEDKYGATAVSGDFTFTTKDPYRPRGTVRINNNARYTNSFDVTLNLSATDTGGSGLDKMQFSNDRKSWSSPEPYNTTAAWKLKEGPSGIRRVYARFIDKAGNVSRNACDVIILDLTKPYGIIYINRRRAVSTGSRDVVLRLRACDRYSGVRPPDGRMKFSNDNITYSDPEPYKRTKSWQLSEGGGAKTVYVKFKDRAGNWSDAISDTIEYICADDIPPQGTVTINSGDLYTNNAEVTLAPFAEDNPGGTGLDTMSFSNDGVTYSPPQTYSPGPVNWTLDAGDGEKTVSAVYTDKEGNSSSPCSDSIILDTTPPGIVVTSPSDGSVIDTATPQVIIAYSDQLSGADTSTFKANINGEDKTSQFSIGPDEAVYQLTEALPEGENTITATVNDIAGNQGSASSSFSVSSSTPPQTEKSGFINGFVFNAQTDTPLLEASVTVEGIGGAVYTDSEGKFIFPTSGSGTYELTIRKDGFTSAQRRVEVVSTRDVGVEPAYLTPLDPKTTHIVAEEGGVVTDSTQTIELDIPGGVLSEDADIRITAMEKLEDIPGPQEDFLCFVFCGKFEPDGVTFNEPVTMLVDNTQNFPPGLEVPLTSWNEETLSWDDIGIGVVTPDGQHIEFTITSFSSKHCNLSLIDKIIAFIKDVTNKVKKKNKRAADPLNWWVDYKEAELSITHKLPAIRSLGLSNSLSLSYFSTTAYPQALIDTEINRVTEPISYQIGWAIDIEGIHKEVKFKGISEDFKTAYLWDAINGRGERVPTGSYPYTIRASNEYNWGGVFKYLTPQGGLLIDLVIDERTSFVFKREGRAIVNNKINSPFGSGWSLDFLQKLYPEPDNIGAVLWTQGGDASIYTVPPESMPQDPAVTSFEYQSPEGDYSKLSHNADGRFTRKTKDGAEFYFNSAGLHLQTIDRNGNVTTYTYDENNLLTSVTDSVGQVTHLIYDANGKLSSITDAAGRITQFNIDANGHLISISNPDGSSVSYAYNEDHLLTSSTDSRDYTTSYTYDSHKRIKEVVMPDGETRHFKPGALQGLINDLPEGVGTFENPADPIPGSYTDVFTDGEGHSTEFKTNAFGSIVEKKDPLGYTTLIERDEASNPTRIERPNGAITTMTYDAAGNLLATTEEGIGATTTFAYEPDFNQVSSITDPMGNITGIDYDEKGNPIGIIDALGNTTTMTYDSSGLLTAITDALANQTQFAYNDKGNLTSITDPLGHTTTLAYDSAGNVTSSTDAAGKTTIYTYDNMNRLTAVTDADGNTAAYSYDSEGNLTSVTDANNKTTLFEYDSLNRLIKTSNPLGLSKTFTYDLNSNLTSTTTPKGETIQFSYDPLNRLIHKALPGNLITNFHYDSVGNLLDIIAPDTIISMDYDPANRLTSVYPNYSAGTLTGIVFSEDETIGPGDTQYEGASIVVNGCTLTVDGTHNFNDIQVVNNGTITHSPASTSDTSRLEITCNALTIDSPSKIDVTGKGYLGAQRGDNASYSGLTLGNLEGSQSGSAGSYGGIGEGEAPNPVYGDFTNPNELGSGGGAGPVPVSTGGNGGGLIKITTNSLNLDGTIIANGENIGPGGSGGAINIHTQTLSGTGTILANGAWQAAGAGRIAIYYTDISSFNIDNILCAGYDEAGAGTIYLKDSAQIYGDLIVDNRAYEEWNYLVTPLRSVGQGTITAVSANTLTDENANFPVPNPATGAVGLIGLKLNPNLNQSQTFTVIDNTATTITVDADISQVASSGDTYTGVYTFDNLYIRNNAKLECKDIINVLSTIEITDAGLKAYDLNFGDASNLDLTNAVIDTETPIFDNLDTVNLQNQSLTINGDGFEAVNNLNLLNSQLVIDGNLSLANDLTLSDNSIISHPSATTVTTSKLNLTCNTLTIDSTSKIDVTGKGYLGAQRGDNASYSGLTLGNLEGSQSGSAGSYGGIGEGEAPNPVYGDFTNPDELGSGGGVGPVPSVTSGSGGGLIKITTNSLNLDGAITANGENIGPGGSGGAINIHTQTLSGTGTISANGAGWSAGGGRIALYYNDISSFNIDNILCTGCDEAGAGTIYLKDSARIYGDLIVDNRGSQSLPATTPLRAAGEGISTSLTSYILTDENADFPVPDPGTGALGLIGLELNPNINQPQTFTIIDNTATTITTDSADGDMTLVAQTGDSYTGEYRFDNLSVINGAKVITEDNIYVSGALDTTGGVLDAANIYQTGKLFNKEVDFVLARLKDYFDINKSEESEEENIQLAKADPAQKEQCKLSSTDPSYTYDLNGNRTSMTDPTGVTYYVYDALNRLRSITNPNGETTTFTYDGLSRRTSMSLPNGINTTYTYDCLSQLKSISHQLASSAISYNYSYDAVGNRTQMADLSGTHNYTYDVINRLIQATHPIPELPTESFNYDPVGNRLNAGSYVYDDANRLLEDNEYTYSYDNNGNMLTRTEKATNQTTTYTYNVENQLLQVDSPDGGVVSYRYDGLGRRIEKNHNGTITQYYYDNEDILLETDGEGNIQARYTHGPGIDEPLIMNREGESYYYHTDGLGSITFITDSSQNTINSYTYDSFGNIIEQTGSLKNPYTYTSREYDPEADLYYYRARYYDPTTGRFLQEDPVSFIGGSNFYTYVANNPVNWIDPFGLWYIDVNISLGYWGGASGGVMIGPQGIYLYGGGGAIAPPPGGVAITWSPHNPSPGWNVGFQTGFWGGFQRGYSFGKDGKGKEYADSKGKGWFTEYGFVTPGASLTVYKAGDPWKWPWRREWWPWIKR